MLFIRQKKFRFFYIYSLYIDNSSYLADTILNDVCLDIDILDETRRFTKNGKQYVLLYVRVLKNDIFRYKRFLDTMKYNMYLFNNDTYEDDCKELIEELNHDEVFGGNWSKGRS